MREALQKCHDLLESTLSHVSHGGPTREEAEAVLAAAKDALGLWEVSALGSVGYTALIYVSKENAKTRDEARSIAGMMFPELIITEVV